MTPTQLRAHLEKLGYSQRQFARVMSRDDREVRRWASGDEPVPEQIATWLDMACDLRTWPA
jgi:DNA-binding transcriptional regulator YiaG